SSDVCSSDLQATFRQRGSRVIILGVALLSGSLLIGTFIGGLLGNLLGVDANVGGVGIAMIVLIVSTNFLARSGRLSPATSSGISFWSGMYIPIVVAMAATERRRSRHRRSHCAHRRGRCRHRQFCAGARAQPGEDPRRRGAGRRVRRGAVMEALISTLTDN